MKQRIEWRTNYEKATRGSFWQGLLDFYQMQLPHMLSQSCGCRSSTNGNYLPSSPLRPLATCSYRLRTGETKCNNRCFVLTLSYPLHPPAPQPGSKKFTSRCCFGEKCFGVQGRKRNRATPRRSQSFELPFEQQNSPWPQEHRFPIAPITSCWQNGLETNEMLTQIP